MAVIDRANRWDPKIDTSRETVYINQSVLTMFHVSLYTIIYNYTFEGECKLKKKKKEKCLWMIYNLKKYTLSTV